MIDSTAPSPPQAEQEGFAIIPGYVLRHPNLTYAEKIVYGRVLALMQNKRGYCWADNGQIAALSGVAHRTVERSIPNLAKVGLVRITGGQNQYRRIYPASPTILDTLPQKLDTVVTQNGAADDAKGRTSSRSRSRTDIYVNTPTEMARVAERILAYHDEVRMRVTGKHSRATTAKSAVKVLPMLGALLSDDAWTEDRLRLVVDGHLAEGSWWREQGHTHARYAFRDEANAERMAEEALAAQPDQEDGAAWPSVDDEPEHEGAWEGLAQTQEGVSS